MVKFRNFGSHSLKEVDQAMKEKGLTFAKEVTIEDNNTTPVIPVALLEEYIAKVKATPPRYVMGIDTATKGNYAFCLMVKTGDDSRVVLAKTSHDEDKFSEEVTNLVKYFNAELFSETDSGLENIRQWTSREK